jgi:hypothetical protein
MRFRCILISPTSSFQTLDQIGIGQHLGKTYLKDLQRLCGMSGVLPTSFMLTEGFDDVELRPFASSRFADVYKATYKGQSVVAKALKITFVDDLENAHKVSGPIFCTIAWFAYIIFAALRKRGCGTEMASTREHLTIHWSYLDTTPLFDGLGLDGEWRYYEFYQENAGP